MRIPSPSPTSKTFVPQRRRIPFGDLTIEYDERVLAPRPWTAAQSAWIVEVALDVPPGRLLELCAGAGHIGLLALRSLDRDGVLVDVDPTACELAGANAAAAGLSRRVEIRRRPIDRCVAAQEEFALVVADPPWVPARDTGRFPADPLLAIDGGDDGLDVARQCILAIDQCLHPEGAAVLQLGSRAQVDALRTWMTGRVDLVIEQVRSFGSRGVLVLLRRDRGPSGRPEAG